MIRSRRFFNIFFITVTLSSMLLGGCSMSSNNYVGREESYADRAPRKLGRGMTNIVSAPLEVFNQPVELATQSNEPAEQAAGYVGGLFVGLAYCGGRMVSGVYDVVTSPFGGPSAPTMEPDLISSEFVDKVDERDAQYSDVTGLGE
ncbi:exosortase system-associated protein, TIGR04073 family [Maridesulfovibrio sp. FT414]|uniref:exosortase system-associated protein, TIGR04073 family n=1 Tax=Maridesulfovibrio sp. FT414 TaxID=2979469 RepID=UPI003D8034DE